MVPWFYGIFDLYIFSFLSTEGMREKEKSQISPVLKQVAAFNTKDNSYSLHKHLYAHVKLDWPEYTEDDIARIKK